MIKHADFVLVGGGLASATAAETLRVEGAEGSILLIAAENELPYHRPPLSTQFLLASKPRSPLPVLTAEYYRDQNVEVALGTRGTAIDPRTHVVQTDLLGAVEYGKLLLATGA